jgi:serine/threonine protein kinase
MTLMDSQEIDSRHDALTDPLLRRAFGFDLNAEAWMGRVRGFCATTQLGRIGSYELIRTAGRGGQGLVYKARQPRTGREVAIKRLSAGVFSTPEMLARFEREIEAAAALQHPNIVTVFGSELVDGQSILVMQWVDGIPINRWASGASADDASGTRGNHDTFAPSRDKAPPRALRAILKLMIQVCEAIQHAHQRGVIHRDLKPTNILVDANDSPHVLDFGLAKLRLEDSSDPGITATGALLGTPAYASPEQMRGDQQDIDIRTDVYSLGAVLYQMLTGRNIFPEGGQVAKILDDIQHRDPSKPSTIDSRLDSELDAIVLKALAKDKELRYASVDAFAADIRHYLAGEAISAVPPSPVYRIRKFVHQYRVLAISIVSITGVLLASTITASTFYFRAQRDRNRAEDALKRESEQRTTAEKNEKTARLEASKQESVNRFLNDMLARADFAKEKKKDLTMREVLDAASQQLNSGKETYEAEVEDALRMTIGKTYWGIGLLRESVPHFRAATELRRKIHGEEHIALTESALYLARALRTTGQLIEAEEVFARVLKIRRAQLGESSPYVAQTLGSMGILQRMLGRYDDAEKTYKQSLAIYRKNFGDDENSADMLNCLSTIMFIQDRLSEAETYDRKSLEICRKLPDSSRGPLISVQTHLAGVLYSQGKNEAGMNMLNDVESLLQRENLSDGIEQANVENVRAHAKLHMGDYTAAEAEMKATLKKLRKFYGPASEITNRANFSLVRALTEQGKFAEAEAVVRGVIEINTFLHIPVSAPDAARPLLLLARIQTVQGCLAEAEALILEVINEIDLARHHTEVPYLNEIEQAAYCQLGDVYANLTKRNSGEDEKPAPSVIRK